MNQDEIVLFLKDGHWLTCKTEETALVQKTFEQEGKYSLGQDLFKDWR